MQEKFLEHCPGSRGSSPGLTAGTLWGDKEDMPSSDWTGDSFTYMSQAGVTEPKRAVSCSLIMIEPSCTHRYPVLNHSYSPQHPASPFPPLFESQKPAIHFTLEPSWGGGVNQIFSKLPDFSGLIASAGFSD